MTVILVSDIDLSPRARAIRVSQTLVAIAVCRGGGGEPALTGSGQDGLLGVAEQSGEVIEADVGVTRVSSPRNRRTHPYSE
ncbi:hypothetical protein MHPYR_130154 [uncultured Mycobacterium sp.]|uniref:Uncharacterized protein n=1 Tax=uncultured Mycobacterium sp. TaxID=171292 RepID=A0A1Y5P190_9MYCO|nr:hypothetical protein MHPYR_130154 [uncultured Mycobacterium sp.]